MRDREERDKQIAGTKLDRQIEKCLQRKRKGERERKRERDRETE